MKLSRVGRGAQPRQPHGRLGRPQRGSFHSPASRPGAGAEAVLRNRSRVSPRITSSSPGAKPAPHGPSASRGTSRLSRKTAGCGGNVAAAGPARLQRPATTLSDLPWHRSRPMPSRAGPMISAARAAISQSAARVRSDPPAGWSGVERQSQHPTALGQRPQHAPRLVAARRVPVGGVGVGGRHRPDGALASPRRRALGRMARVDDKADAIHLRDHLASHSSEAGLLFPLASARQQRLVSQLSCRTRTAGVCSTSTSPISPSTGIGVCRPKTPAVRPVRAAPRTSSALRACTMRLRRASNRWFHGRCWPPSRGRSRGRRWWRGRNRRRPRASGPRPRPTRWRIAGR